MRACAFLTLQWTSNAICAHNCDSLLGIKLVPLCLLNFFSTLDISEFKSSEKEAKSWCSSYFLEKKTRQFLRFSHKRYKNFHQPKSFEAPIRFLQAKKFLNERRGDLGLHWLCFTILCNARLPLNQSGKRQ